MKRIILLIAFSMLAITSDCFAQLGYGYKTITDVSLQYDDYWDPIISFTLENGSDSSITGVEITVTFKGDAQSQWGYTMICRTNTMINPRQKGRVIFRVDTDKIPIQFGILRTRYSDGSVHEWYPERHGYIFF